MERTVRILMVKFGEGYDEAMTRLSLAFREAGFEIIYTDTQRPEAIVASAIQESVDHIGITTLPGADLGNIKKTIDLLRDSGVDDIQITAGGFLSLFGLNYYSGNIFGAITSAHKFNKQKREEHLRRAMGNYDVQPDGVPLVRE